MKNVGNEYLKFAKYHLWHSRMGLSDHRSCEAPMKRQRTVLDGETWWTAVVFVECGKWFGAGWNSAQAEMKQHQQRFFSCLTRRQ